MEKIVLKYPIEIDGKQATELKMRRCKVRDQLAVTSMKNLTDQEREVRMFANLCEVPPDAIENLDIADYMKLSEVFQGFLSATPETSGKPS